MVLVGIPFTEPALNATRTGGTPYGASHVAGLDDTAPLSDDEKVLARALGRRLADTARRLAP
jgi:NAD(P)H dehydrogenase (quinone)